MEKINAVCKDFMYKKCIRENCKFLHDPSICFYYWKIGECNRGEKCERSHQFIDNKQNTRFLENDRPFRENNQRFVDNKQSDQFGENNQRFRENNQTFVENRQQFGENNRRFVENRQQFGENNRRFGETNQRFRESDRRFVDNEQNDRRFGENNQRFVDNKQSDQFGKNNQIFRENDQFRMDKKNDYEFQRNKNKKVRGKNNKEQLPKQKPKKNKDKYNKNKRKKNTECFDPMTRPVDMRIVCDLGGLDDKCSLDLTSRDVLLAPNVFNNFKNGELYNKLVEEIEACDTEFAKDENKDKLLKMWHGNDKIEGTHLIANDRTNWKEQCPTFNLVIDRLKEYFSMDIQATRFNWYKDTSQWKPFHHDAASVKPEKAATQNFTVAVSFGTTRDAAFEHAETKTVISMPQPDSTIYAFAKDVNIIWRHGILQDIPVKENGRISIICWGKLLKKFHQNGLTPT